MGKPSPNPNSESHLWRPTWPKSMYLLPRPRSARNWSRRPSGVTKCYCMRVLRSRSELRRRVCRRCIGSWRRGKTGRGISQSITLWISWWRRGAIGRGRPSLSRKPDNLNLQRQLKARLVLVKPRAITIFSTNSVSRAGVGNRRSVHCARSSMKQ